VAADADPLQVSFNVIMADANPKKKERNQMLYKLSLVLSSYDLLLMKSAVADIEPEKFITMHRVIEELEMLKVCFWQKLTR
jgi:hypothetical protein